jgi:hypothetical protein
MAELPAARRARGRGRSRAGGLAPGTRLAGCRGAGLPIGLSGAEDQVGDGAGVGDHGGVG